MKYVPNAVSRTGHRALLKLNAKSPTILVVSGVIGLGATAILAAKATRKIDPILDNHEKARAEIGYVGQNRKAQKELSSLYVHTAIDLGKLYGPTIILGSTSAIAVLGGHRILRGRHIATMAAYSGLAEQFQSYRERVAKTLGSDVEQGLYNGAHGERVEDPDHPGEYKLEPKFEDDNRDSYLRPWFDETNYNWTKDGEYNYMWLKGMQTHMNQLLAQNGHVFLNEVYDALKLPRRPEGAVAGWLYKGDGDGYVDFGIITSIDPHTVAFRRGLETTVRLNFNIDGIIWQKI